MVTYPPDVLKRLQEEELEILDVVARFCAEHGIKWFLEGGTALGAVRHQGFIPWDDDVDIGMTRDDYCRFIALAETGLPDGFELHTPRNTNEMAACFSKVCKKGTHFWTQEIIDSGFDQGIFIDVFCYDIVSSDQKQRRKQIRNASKYVKMRYLYASGNLSYPLSGITAPILQAGFKVAHTFLRAFANSNSLYEKYEAAIQCPPGFESDECFVFAGPSGGSPLKSSLVAETVSMKFEDKSFPVPADYEGYLEWMFGSTWRELPPEDKRKNHAPILLDFGDGINALECH